MTLLRIETTQDVAVLILDNPPANALSLDLRIALLDALEQVARDVRIKGVVLAGTGRFFCAGGDVKQMGKSESLRGPGMRDFHQAMAAGMKPVVAAITGDALGGGLELALGCDGRIAAPGVVMALPEVHLGLLPGGGGTVRLTRIAGAERALDLILSGRRIAADEAVALGVIDAVAADPVAAAIAQARTPASASRDDNPRRAATKLDDPHRFFAASRSRIMQEQPGSLAHRHILACIEQAYHLPLQAALDVEQDAYRRLAQGEGAEQHRARVAAFFERQQARRQAS